MNVLNWVSLRAGYSFMGFIDETGLLFHTVHGYIVNKGQHCMFGVPPKWNNALAFIIESDQMLPDRKAWWCLWLSDFFISLTPFHQHWLHSYCTVFKFKEWPCYDSCWHEWEWTPMQKEELNGSWFVSSGDPCRWFILHRSLNALFILVAFLSNHSLIPLLQIQRGIVMFTASSGEQERSDKAKSYFPSFASSELIDWSVDIEYSYIDLCCTCSTLPPPSCNCACSWRRLCLFLPRLSLLQVSTNISIKKDWIFLYPFEAGPGRLIQFDWNEMPSPLFAAMLVHHLGESSETL